MAIAALASGVLRPCHRVAASGPVRIPVLMYHYIRDNPVPSDRVGYNLSVTPGDFARQMDYLQRIGAHSVSMGNVMDAIEGTASLPPRSVVLTFDDGYGDFATTAEP